MIRLKDWLWKPGKPEPIVLSHHEPSISNRLTETLNLQRLQPKTLNSMPEILNPTHTPTPETLSSGSSVTLSLRIAETSDEIQHEENKAPRNASENQSEL